MPPNLRPVSAVLLALGLVAGGVAATANPAPLAPGLIAAGWQELPFDDKKRNRFLGDQDQVTVISEGGVSMLYRDVEVDLSDTPTLAWRWRVDRTMAPTSLSQKGQDDRPIAVYLSFPFDPAAASWGERLLRPLVEALKGPNAPGRVIAYTWGGLGNRGDLIESPYLKSAGAIIVLRPGDAPTGQWFEERVDIAADYQRVFGSPAPAPGRLAISADSDDSQTASHASIAEIRFTQK